MMVTGPCRIWASHQHPVKPDIPLSRSTQSSRRVRTAKCCRARQDDRGEGGGIDWDAEWRKAKEKLPEVESNTSTRRPSTRLQRDKIREQESLILDVFSGENFFKVAGGLVLAILFIFIVIIGPPNR